jgi:hypothetical protein
MKKQIKKLSLNKKTISNLTAAEMNMQVGGAQTKGHTCREICVRSFVLTCAGRTCVTKAAPCF